MPWPFDGRLRVRDFSWMEWCQWGAGPDSPPIGLPPGKTTPRCSQHLVLTSSDGESFGAAERLLRLYPGQSPSITWRLCYFPVKIMDGLVETMS